MIHSHEHLDQIGTCQSDSPVGGTLIILYFAESKEGFKQGSNCIREDCKFRNPDNCQNSIVSQKYVFCIAPESIDHIPIGEGQTASTRSIRCGKEIYRRSTI